MTKKIIALLLSVIFVFSALAVGTFAADDEFKTYDPDFKDTITADDQAKYPAEELAITNPEERIDIAFLTGKYAGGTLLEEAACKSTLEYNLYFWKDEIINEYHDLEADEDATAEQWGALYRKMKTPKNNDWSEESAYYDFWYEYRDESKAVCDIKFVTSKTELQPGEEFEVEVYLTTNFYVGTMYSTFFYNNDVVDILSCTEKYIGTDKENVQQPEELKKMHPLGERWGQNRTYLGEIPHYGDYTYGGFSSLLGDMRDVEWPASLTSIDGYKDKYEAYNIIFNRDDAAKECPAIQFNNEILVTLKFKVQDEATPGSIGTIFVPSDSVYTMNSLALYENYPWEHNGVIIKPCWQFFRLSPNTDTGDGYMPEYSAQYDQTIKCTPLNITVAGDDGADYTAFDTEYALFNSADSVLYTSASWAAYASAYTSVSSLSRDLTTDEQSIVDAATLQLSTAREALVLNKLVSANTVGAVNVGSNATVKVVANGSPKTIRLVDADSNALTFDRANATITAEGDNEAWTISVPVTANEQNYTVYAKYGVEFGNDSVPLSIAATQGLDLSIHSVSIPDAYGSKIYQGRHNVIVRTSIDVHKVQFIDADGNTVTYDKVNATPVVDGDEYVWTLNFNFCKLGNYEYGFRTRAVNSTFALTGTSISGKVVY